MSLWLLLAKFVIPQTHLEEETSYDGLSLDTAYRFEHITTPVYDSETWLTLINTTRYVIINNSTFHGLVFNQSIGVNLIHYSNVYIIHSSFTTLSKGVYLSQYQWVWFLLAIIRLWGNRRNTSGFKTKWKAKVWQRWNWGKAKLTRYQKYKDSVHAQGAAGLNEIKMKRNSYAMITIEQTQHSDQKKK